MADDCIPDRTGAVSTADTRRCDVCGETSAATLMQDTTPTNYCAAPLSQLNPNAAAATEPPVCGICGEKSIAAYYTATRYQTLYRPSFVVRPRCGRRYAEIARLQAD
jgi:hypothetical protein